MSAVVGGGIVFGVFVLLGITLLNRIGTGVAVVILGAAGAYAGWLVGLLVFGAVRGADGHADGQEEKS